MHQNKAENLYSAFINLIKCIDADDDPIKFGRELNKKFIEMTGTYPRFYS